MKGFFRALDFTLPWEVDGVEDAMPVDIDALEEWTVGDRMLDDMLRGMEPAEARDAEWRRGTLPPGRLGWRKATEICEQAVLLADAARGYRSAKADAVDVDIDLGGRRLTGTVSPVFGDRLVSVTYSKLGGKHLLQSWIPLLALHAHDPSRDWSAVCIGRAKRGTAPQVNTLRRPRDSAVDLLADLVAMYDAGSARAAAAAGQDVVRVGGCRSHAWRSGAGRRVPVEVRQLSRRGCRACARPDLGRARMAERPRQGGARRLRRAALWLPMLRAMDA